MVQYGMVLAAMANPPEHDFAPSWLKIPSDQQKRGQKIGASDQWSPGNHKTGQQPDNGNKARHRHYSNDSSYPSGGYGRSPSALSTSPGPLQGGYGCNRSREPDRRYYSRPGSGSRHHSVDDLNGFPGGWNIPQYNGYYSNYPRRGASSAGLRDPPVFPGNSPRYGDVFHGGRGGYYNNGGGRGSGNGGRQRYNSGSRSGYSDRDSKQDGSAISHGGNEGHSDVSAKKERGEDIAKNSALSSNDFPSLLGNNSKPGSKDAAKNSTLAGAWDKPPGTAKVQISGRKVQLIKKSIHNDLPPRDTSATSSIKSSGKSPSPGVANSDGSTGDSKTGANARVNRPPSVGPASASSSSSGIYKPAATVDESKKASHVVKVNDIPASSSAKLPSPKPASKDSQLHSPKLSTAPSSPKFTTNDATATKPPTIQAQPDKFVEKSNPGVAEAPKFNVTRDVNLPLPSAKKVESKAGPSDHTQTNGVNAKSSSKELSCKPVLGASTISQNQKPTAKQNFGKESLTKPVLVATRQLSGKESAGNKPILVVTQQLGKEPPNKAVLVDATITQKPATRPLGGKESPTKLVLVATTTQMPVARHLVGKESPTKPILVAASTTMKTAVKSTKGTSGKKDSPVRPVPVQIKSTKFSGKEHPVRSFTGRGMVTSKQGSRDRSVRPGPVQIKSNREMTTKENPAHPVPVHIMTRKPTAKDNSSVAMTIRSLSPSSSREKMVSASSSYVNTTTIIPKESSANPATTASMDNPRIGLNKNVNNCDHRANDGVNKGLQNGGDILKGLQNGGDSWVLKQNNGPLRIEDALKINGSQHSTLALKDKASIDSNKHLTTNGLDNDPRHPGRTNLELSSSLEAEKRLLQEMGWHEHSDNEEGYAPITEDEMKEFQRRSQQLKRNGITRNLPAAFVSSSTSLPSTPVTSIDLDDALSSCSSDSSDDDL